uniref:Gypsy retrotransposon integrase-like protein 1 n=1 Tax=Oreochromis niloticus TaxID=8128 RepID=A0A669FBS4_ORENI
MQNAVRPKRGNKMEAKEALQQPEREKEMEEGISVVAGDTEGEDTREPTLLDIAGILQSFMGQQEVRDKKQREDAILQEQRFKSLQHQFRLLQMEVQARTTPLPEPTSTDPEPVETPADYQTQATSQHEGSGSASILTGQSVHIHHPKLEKLAVEDDVEHFLTTFERIAAACRWPESDWIFHLIPLLTGKARSAYVNMDVDDSLQYEKVKAAILQKYDINPETYRQRFRCLEVFDESPKELYARLKELYEKWIQPKNRTIKEVGEIIVLEQFLRMLCPELQVWIKEHNPKSAAEAATLADVFVAARSKSQPWSNSAWKAARDSRRSQPPQHPQRSATGVGKPFTRENQPPNTSKPGKRPPVCYLCGQEGHTKPMCPNNQSKLSQMCFVPHQNLDIKSERKQSNKITTVKINGQEMNALIDTGSTQTLVHRKYVSNDRTCPYVTISVCCIHGDERPYPTADLFIEVQGTPYLLKVGVADSLPYPVVLGEDLPVIYDLLREVQECNVAITRAQTKNQDDHYATLSALPFFEAELETEPGKSRKPRSQRRREKFQHTVGKTSVQAAPDMPLGFSVPTNIRQMQQADLTLSAMLLRAKEKDSVESDTNKEQFILQDGILYHQHGQVKQLVVPKVARETVLTLGHSIPWAGHLGKHKTTARIKRYFFWPGLHSDVAMFCRSCPQCQKTSIRVPTKAPLQPLPIIGIPFQRLGMDVVGPVEKSKAGNRFMLVITDYATRYPEVFPLKTVKAKAVASSLIQLFSRVGFPQEILTDQGTNFMSTLLKQVYKLLGIRSVRTTPYHPQTDGLTERFNQTLKQMLRKFVNDTGSDWDQWLPYLLFAYREVPQASTGFSPFELLYGHEVRGPLTLLKDSWEGEQGKEESVSVISYVIHMREKLQQMSELAQSHMAAAQRQQKTLFDKKARHRSFVPGQKVLVMLPTSDSKLLAKWQGPFEVQKKLGPTTYKVSTPGLQRGSRVLHVNLLKEWIPRTESKTEGLLIHSVDEEEEVNDYLPSVTASVLDLNHLTSEQQSQVTPLINSDTFQKYPGRTSLVEHDIVLKPDAAVKRMSYRIPERFLVELKEEVDLMLSLGIIQPSASEWCNPVVLAPKKDSTIRFCIDFRYLNSISKFDSYPMPRIDDLIERLGKAKYLTTIDLSKGYWQVPLTKQSQELTAFRTPWGLFEFTVLPFGLHGAPATFQRLMDKVLCGLSAFTCAYLDDVVVFSGTWEEHVDHLRVVLDRLRSAGLTINPAKCALARTEVQYLGFTVGGGTIKPQVDKINAIASCPLPQTRKQLRSFLGMAAFYNGFIPNFSARAAPLTDSTGSRCPNKIRWTAEAIAAFKDIRQSLSKDPVLHSPDFTKDFTLQTDASERGLGAVLLQGPPEDRHPVAYISRKLLPRESRYATVEKEALVIKWALDSFKYYLLGREFILQTDHKALQWLERMKDTNGRITRWYLAMQPYRFKVHYIPGKDNTTADYLSRCLMEDPEVGGV